MGRASEECILGTLGWNSCTALYFLGNRILYFLDIEMAPFGRRTRVFRATHQPTRISSLADLLAAATHESVMLTVIFVKCTGAQASRFVASREVRAMSRP